MSLTSTNIKSYLKNKDSSFKLFDIKYTEEEKQTINNFKIDNETEFIYTGKFDKDTLLKDNKINILKFIESIGNNTEKNIKIIKNIIYKLLDKVTNGYGKNYIDLIISIQLPNKEFNMARWHTDGYFNNSKFITVLKGPSTLFIDDKDIKSRKTYFTIQDLLMKKYVSNGGFDEKAHDKYRKILAKKLKDAKIVQPKNNQGTIFLTDAPVNNTIIAGIHSEPPINEKRFFIGVMCGKI
tara:strand:- start:253 stop:966 length:714 start_codon:yes stop_codon:yes gene_type:complete